MEYARAPLAIALVLLATTLGLGIPRAEPEPEDESVVRDDMTFEVETAIARGFMRSLVHDRRIRISQACLENPLARDCM